MCYGLGCGLPISPVVVLSQGVIAITPAFGLEGLIKVGYYRRVSIFRTNPKVVRSVPWPLHQVPIPQKGN